jgi:tetratricopeptide (TPR) repeat protein
MKTNRNIFTYCILLILFIVICFTGCQKVSDALFLKGPYLQNVKMDGITIMWESEKPYKGKIIFGQENDLVYMARDKKVSTIHEIVLWGLKPETQYTYKVIIPEGKSKKYFFKTAVRKETPFTFITYGDNKSGPTTHEKNANLMASQKPDFVLHNGDMVDRGFYYKQWKLFFFNPARNLLNYAPLYPVLGNHENNSEHYYNFFSLPNNERWYSFNYGNAHFIMLDSDLEQLEENSEQLNWLIEDLKSNNATWTFVSFHYPPFTAGGNYYRESRIKRKNLLHPILEEYGVDFVFNGHDHHYERTYPIVSKEGSNPVTYIISGNGGTPMRYHGQRIWTLYAERIFGFVKIQIDNEKLHFQSINIDEEVIDEFNLDKSDSLSVAAYEANKIYFEDIIDPVKAIKYYSKGDDLLDEEQFEKALHYFERAYETDTTFVQALAGIAECNYKLGQFDEAIEYAMKGVSEMGYYPGNYEVLIDVYMDQENYEAALEWSEKWINIQPDQADVNEIVAEIYENQNKLELAIEEINKAISLSPTAISLYVQLGELYEKTGNKKKALAAYKKALYWFSDNRRIEQKEKAMSRIEILTKR